ncbi:MAG TPA: plasmid mobilization relaxosome protein MobC [Pseudolabrys sp.]|uniref:plasmid mobilization protein n=1 Tax=Pseudolabrys sp. TaxID=1960880 RepID=UPI002DDCEC3F|nr:plasmid mobilization relaxosome protein MobC [Pseudolabrys sp.]HEV2630516.1 plasmid mobilization relaxosome protein MobC [Pseudolabrys sp.]
MRQDHRQAGQGESPVQPQTKKPRRTAALRLRVTQEERRSIVAAADAAGMGICSFARVTVLRAVGQVPVDPPARRQMPTEAQRSLGTFLGQLGRIGNNANQVARKLNSGLAVEQSILADIRDELRHLRQAVLDELGEGGCQ